MNLPILSILLWWPIAGCVLLLGINKQRAGLLKIFTSAVLLIELGLASLLYIYWTPGMAGMQFTEKIPWITEFGISYSLGIDGISLFLVLLTAYLMPVAYLSAWKAIDAHLKGFSFLMLLLTTALLGVFISSDLFLFYVFWELTLIPMYFLIGIWGGPRRVYATIKFFIYTMAGSVIMLVALICLYYLHHQEARVFTFDIPSLLETPLDPSVQLWLFWGLFLAFAVKVPLFPLHTWLPDAHVEAPTAGSIILAGVLLKMGGYGFIRFCLPLFPAAMVLVSPIVLTLAVISIVYGAMMVMVQTDLKKLVAYSSVSHMGFVILGVYSLGLMGVTGSVLQMVNHGLSTGALFLIVGILYERTHTRELSKLGGVSKVMPKLALFFLPVVLSSLALPSTNGFVGEFLILLGTFKPHPYFTAVAALGVILAAVYLLTMYQKVMLGKVTNEVVAGLKDIDGREFVLLASLVVLIFAIGLYPSCLLDKIEPSVQPLVSRYTVETKPLVAAHNEVIQTSLLTVQQDQAFDENMEEK